MNKRVLYLSYDGLTDPLGQSQILPYLEGLSEFDYRFTIISFEKTGRFENLKKRIQERCKKSNIDWHPLSYTKNPPILSTLYDIQGLQELAEKLHRKKGFVLIHCRSYLTPIVALRLKKKFAIPFIFDMRGFWADERVDGNIWNVDNPIYRAIYRYFKIKERTFLEEAEAVVSLTHAGKAELENWFNENPLFGGNENYYNYDRTAAVLKKTSVIPCSTDLDHFDLHRITAKKRQWLGAVHGIDPKLEYLGYVGSLGTWYMADEMLNLYSHLLQSRPKLRFLILSHDNLDSLRERAALLNISRSYIIQIAAERKEVPALMSMMAASVFFILPAYSKKASSPTKQGELMAMGIPVICNDNVGDTGEIVRRYNAGHVATGFDDSDFQEIADQWDALIQLNPEEIREGAKEYFSLEKGVAAYAEIYVAILAKKDENSRSIISR